MTKKNRGIGIYIIIVLVLIASAIYMFGQIQPKNVSYQDVVEHFQAEQVKEYELVGSNLTLKLQDDTTVTHTLASMTVFLEDLQPLIAEQRLEGIIVDSDYQAGTDMYILASIIPYVVLFGGILLFWYFMAKKQDGGRSAMNFGKSRARVTNEGDVKVTFDDVAGADEEKSELVEIVDFLKNPQKYITLGARIPKGVLLVGPPGTGKTLLAKAVAGEAGVPFLTISGSDFVELYVGVGASRVRDLFNEAKKNQPAIIFIDEIDAVGRQRGAGLGGGHDEREQTLNQLLVEMDGFGVNQGVIVIAATNRSDILDPALLRPGRFDRQVYVGVPDLKGREEILKVHAKNKKLNAKLELRDIAKSTPGFTGADLENLLNEGALLSARRGKSTIEQEDIEDSFLKVIMGTEKRSRIITDHEKKLTAYHEAGHAIVTKLLPTQDPVHQVSIIPRGGAGGFTLSLPQEDKFYRSKIRMEEELIVLLGGRVAEKIVLGDISTGASNDIERASKIARDMVTRYGMSDLVGTINYATDPDEVFLGRQFGHNSTFSNETVAMIDKEVEKIIHNAYTECERLLRENMDKLVHVAEFLIRNEVIDGETFEKLFVLEELEDLPKKTYSYAKIDRSKKKKDNSNEPIFEDKLNGVNPFSNEPKSEVIDSAYPPIKTEEEESEEDK